VADQRSPNLSPRFEATFLEMRDISRQQSKDISKMVTYLGRISSRPNNSAVPIEQSDFIDVQDQSPTTDVSNVSNVSNVSTSRDISSINQNIHEVVNDSEETTSILSDVKDSIDNVADNTGKITDQNRDNLEMMDDRLSEVSNRLRDLPDNTMKSKGASVMKKGLLGVLGNQGGQGVSGAMGVGMSLLGPVGVMADQMFGISEKVGGWVSNKASEKESKEGEKFEANKELTKLTKQQGALKDHLGKAVKNKDNRQIEQLLNDQEELLREIDMKVNVVEEHDREARMQKLVKPSILPAKAKKVLGKFTPVKKAQKLLQAPKMLTEKILPLKSQEAKGSKVQESNAANNNTLNQFKKVFAKQPLLLPESFLKTEEKIEKNLSKVDASLAKPLDVNVEFPPEIGLLLEEMKIIARENISMDRRLRKLNRMLPEGIQDLKEEEIKSTDQLITELDSIEHKLGKIEGGGSGGLDRRGGPLGKILKSLGTKVKAFGVAAGALSKMNLGAIAKGGMGGKLGAAGMVAAAGAAGYAIGTVLNKTVVDPFTSKMYDEQEKRGNESAKEGMQAQSTSLKKARDTKIDTKTRAKETRKVKASLMSGMEDDFGATFDLNNHEIQDHIRKYDADNMDFYSNYPAEQLISLRKQFKFREVRWGEENKEYAKLYVEAFVNYVSKNGTVITEKQEKAEIEKIETQDAKIGVAPSKKPSVTEKKKEVITPPPLPKLDAKQTAKALEKEGIVDLDWIGNSEIEDWGKVQKLPSNKIQALIDYKDWGDEDTTRLIKVHASKLKAESGGIEKAATSKEPSVVQKEAPNVEAYGEAVTKEKDAKSELTAFEKEHGKAKIIGTDKSGFVDEYGYDDPELTKKYKNLSSKEFLASKEKKAVINKEIADQAGFIEPDLEGKTGRSKRSAIKKANFRNDVKTFDLMKEKGVVAPDSTSMTYKERGKLESNIEQELINASTRTANAVEKMSDAGTEEGSLYTHDITAEEQSQELIDETAGQTEEVKVGAEAQKDVSMAVGGGSGSELSGQANSMAQDAGSNEVPEVEILSLEDLTKPMKAFSEAALDKGSIYTHDITAEEQNKKLLTETEEQTDEVEAGARSKPIIIVGGGGGGTATTESGKKTTSASTTTSTPSSETKPTIIPAPLVTTDTIKAEASKETKPTIIPESIVTDQGRRTRPKRRTKEELRQRREGRRQGKKASSRKSQLKDAQYGGTEPTVIPSKELGVSPMPGESRKKGSKYAPTEGMSSNEKAMSWFTSEDGGGFTKEQAAGIVGNLNAESNLNAKAFNPAGGGQGAQGIAQWRGSRLKDFEKFSGKSVKDADLEEQLKFVSHEMTEGKEQRAGKKLRGASSAADAALMVDKFYERSGGHHVARRQKFAEEAMKVDLEKTQLAQVEPEKMPKRELTEEQLKADFEKEQGADWKAKKDALTPKKKRRNRGMDISGFENELAMEELEEEKAQAFAEYKKQKTAPISAEATQQATSTDVTSTALEVAGGGLIQASSGQPTMSPESFSKQVGKNEGRDQQMMMASLQDMNTNLSNYMRQQPIGMGSNAEGGSMAGNSPDKSTMDIGMSIVASGLL
jgi:hypothetical protein